MDVTEKAAPCAGTSGQMRAAMYDAKPYDVRYFQPQAPGEIEWRFHEFRLNEETALSAQGMQAVCVFVNDRLDRQTLQALAEQKVRLVALRCAGFNNVDLTAASECGIRVVRVPAYSPHAVAEHAAGLLLTLNRKIHRAFNRVREHNFSLHGLVGFDMHGKTMGIVGTGKIGRIAARIFSGFDMTVIAFDPYPMPDWAAAADVQYVEFGELLARSDVVSLHVPLTPETLHMLRAETIAQMKKGAFIVNTSRGKLIETQALLRALKQGHLGGVALDVYEEEEGVFFEDLSDRVLEDDDLSRLLTFPNVLVTSHQAFLTHEALTEIARVTAVNIRRFSCDEDFLPGTVLA